MATARLKFDEQEKTVVIFFKDGGESKSFRDKLEFFEALNDFVKNEKLTMVEANAFLHLGLTLKDFPDGEGNTFFSSTEYIGDVIFPFLQQEPTWLQLFSHLFEDVCQSKVLEKPLFRVCGCGKHGMIVFKLEDDGPLISDVLYTKIAATHAVHVSKRKLNLSADDVQSLFQAIRSSSLPDI
jgi:hypothetical protein